MAGKTLKDCFIYPGCFIKGSEENGLGLLVRIDIDNKITRLRHTFQHDNPRHDEKWRDWLIRSRYKDCVINEGITISVRVQFASSLREIIYVNEEVTELHVLENYHVWQWYQELRHGMQSLLKKTL